jgi:hypothetical protein
MGSEKIPPNDDLDPLDNEWDPLQESREWSAAETELACFSLARRKGKRLVKIINTTRKVLPIICIFEDYTDE